MKRFAVIFVVGLLCSLGCHRSGILGKWKIDPAFIKAHLGDTPEKSMAEIGTTFAYEFLPDNTFKGAVSEGAYNLDGSHLSMTRTKLMGQNLSTFGGKADAPPMTGELSSDGETLTLHPPASRSLPESLTSGIRLIRDTTP